MLVLLAYLYNNNNNNSNDDNKLYLYGTIHTGTAAERALQQRNHIHQELNIEKTQNGNNNGKKVK